MYEIYNRRVVHINIGKKFEIDFRKSIPKYVYCERMPDAAVGFNMKKNKEEDRTIRFAPKSPYDYILYCRPELYCIELKTSGKNGFTFKGKSSNIRERQIRSLLKAAHYANAGFILNFRKTGNTYYLEINSFCEIIKSISKSSINETDIKDYAIKIPHKLLRKSYRYDISPLFPLKTANQ